MAGVSLSAAAAFAAKTALEAGNSMEATFLSARAGDRDGAMAMAKDAAAKALLAKKALATALHGQTAADSIAARNALGHVEDARLFAKAAMTVFRSSARRGTDKQGAEPAKKAGEAMAFLMAAGSALLDIKRGTGTDATLRKAALAAERTTQAADDAIRYGGAGNGHGEDAQAAKETAGEIARRALWAIREAAK